MPVNSQQKIQLCKVLCHAAKSMQKSDCDNFDQLSPLLFSGVQANLNQVDHTVRNWSLLVFELLTEKFGQKEGITLLDFFLEIFENISWQKAPKFEIDDTIRAELDVDLSEKAFEAYFEPLAQSQKSKPKVTQIIEGLVWFKT